MKKHLLLIMISLFTLASCVKDETVHNFSTLNSIEIGGLEDSYIFNFMEEASVEPTVNVKISNPTNLEYRWYMYTVTSRIADTLSREKNLNALITATPGEAYTLVFSVKEVNSGLTHKKTMNAEVIGEFTRGTMFLTEENGKVDIKFLKPDGELKHDIIAKANPGITLGADTHKVQFVNPSNYKPQCKNIYIGAVNAEGGMLLDPISFKKAKSFREAFHVSPKGAILDLQTYGKGYFVDYMIINGKLYNRAVNSGDPLWKPELIIADPSIPTTYELAPVFINERTMTTRSYVYDNLNGRFLKHPAYNRGYLEQFTGGTTTAFDYNNTGMKMLFAHEAITPTGNTGAYFYAITEPKDDPSKKYLMTFLDGKVGTATTNAFNAMGLNELTPDLYPGIHQATMFAGDVSMKGVLWYSDGQKLYALNTNDAAAQEIVAFDFSAQGLEATVMKFYTYTIQDETGANVKVTELRVAVRDIAMNDAGLLYLEGNTLGGINIQEKSRIFGLGERIIDFDEKLN